MPMLEYRPCDRVIHRKQNTFSSFLSDNFENRLKKLGKKKEKVGEKVVI